MIRFFALMVVVYVTLGLGPLPAALMGFVYMMRWFAPELLLFAAVIDSYFGVGYLPYYTISTAVLIMVVEWYKPLFSFYTKR